MSNRFPTEPPVLQPMQELTFKRPEKRTLSNGVEVYGINAGGQDVIRLEIVFEAGRTQENARALATTAARLMREGAAGKSSSELSEYAERIGGSIRSGANHDFGTLSVYSLSRNLDKILPLAADIIRDANFDEKEINTYISNSKQKLSIKEQQGEYLADTLMRANVYGPEHVYGYRTSAVDLDQLDRQQLVDFHQRYYASGHCTIFASGKVDESVYPLLEKHFGSRPLNRFEASAAPSVAGPMELHQEKADAVQSAIRFGMKTIPKSHPDFLKLFVTNTILGGYFGSRLMSNIREDKGYTYGIYSGITHHSHHSHFYISTEVGIDVCEAAIKETRFEIERLRTEAVSKEELELVSNYLLGSLMSSVDGPFHTAGTVKGMVLSKLELDFVDRMVHTIQHIKAVDIKEMAVKYLDPSAMHEIVVGWPEKT